MSRRTTLHLFVAIALTLSCTPLLAHEVRPAYLQIDTQSDAQGSTLYSIMWKQPIVQGGRLAIDPVFPPGCELEERAPPELTPSALIHRWTTDCNLRDGSIHISGLSITLTDVLVRFTTRDGEVNNFVLRPEAPTLELSTPGASTLQYFRIGVEHLVFGIDHVLFVVGLVLFIRVPWMLLKTITAFTIAHSITLALSVLGFVSVQQGPVEAVIALSILFLARELLLPESKRSQLTAWAPWLMAFVFGLLHGLGFAGALRDVGLPEDTLWLALLLFNVGIEVGQIAIIAALLVLGWLWQRFQSVDKIIRSSAWIMGCVAAYWTIDRTLLLI